MRVRSKFWPRTIPDVAATTFLLTMIPVTFWFELWIVVPEIHGFGSGLHLFYFGLGVFVAFNIVSNLFAIMICETSLRNQIVQPPENAEEKGWRLCTTCEAVAPPRSWHCSVCNTCILKRDHHCIFSGCCIGFHNHRYFMMLLFYLALATGLCAVYNSYFIWFVNASDFKAWVSYAKVMFPLAFLVVDYSFRQYYFLIYLIDMIGAFLTGTLFYYHCTLIKDGTVVHERNRKIGKVYNLGLKQNILLVLGQRYYLTWVSPFVTSTISHDGIHWENILNDSNKNR